MQKSVLARAPTPELERRPSADSRRIEDLLAEVLQGKVRIPPFQRGLRWDDEDRVKLFDSILRGYPIGTLLFWKRSAEAGPLEIGRLRIDASDRTDALWVVDGQQRLISLADALLVPAEAESKKFAVDLETLEVRLGRDLLPPRWLPLFEASDTERLYEWIHQHAPSEELRRAAFAVGKRLREYDVPLYIVDTDDEEVLRRIFDRVNSTGKALRQAEVFDALHGGRSTDKPSSLNQVASEIESLGFGRPEEKLVLRAVLALRRKDPSRGFRQIDSQDVPAALADANEGLARAVTFVISQAGFPHLSLLPYKLPLATLALFFHEHRDPKKRTLVLLRRWMWRGAINGSHRGDTVGLRSTLAAIDPRDEEGSAQALLRGVGNSSVPFVLPLRPFNFRHARSKLQLVALAELMPRDLETHQLIDVGMLCSEEQPQPPGQYLTSSPEADGPSGGLAGRILHRRLAPTLLRKLVGQAPQSVLASHAIPTAAADTLREGNTVEFFERRERHLELVVSEFLNRQAEWGTNDRPTLDYLKAPPWS